MLNKLKHYIVSKIHIADEIARAKSVEIIESEVTQMEYIFSVLTFGQFIGYPSVPSQIMFELLSESENSINLLIERMNTQNEPLAELASIFRID
jgi:hypothetical protein